VHAAFLEPDGEEVAGEGVGGGVEEEAVRGEGAELEAQVGGDLDGEGVVDFEAGVVGEAEAEADWA